jgi:hypothetical protein
MPARRSMPAGCSSTASWPVTRPARLPSSWHQPQTVYKWVHRYRAEGLAGLADGSSLPHRIARLTFPEDTARIVAARVAEHAGPVSAGRDPGAAGLHDRGSHRWRRAAAAGRGRPAHPTAAARAPAQRPPLRAPARRGSAARRCEEARPGARRRWVAGPRSQRGRPRPGQRLGPRARGRR